MKDTGSGWREKQQHWFTYLKIGRKYLKYFKTHPLKITFDSFGI